MDKEKLNHLIETMQVWADIMGSKECFFCKKKFDKEFFNKKREGQLNAEMLFHIEETHGFQPIDTFNIMSKCILSKYPETQSWFDTYEPLFEAASD